MKNSLRSIGNISTKITAPLLGKQGHVLGAVLQDWQKIVGDKIASLTCPQKLVFRNEKRTGGTLYLLASTGSGPLIQQISPAIIERINTYFGYTAVSHLKIQQGFLPPKASDRQEEMTLSDKDKSWIDENTKSIDDEELKIRLQSFAESLLKAEKLENRHK